MYLLGHLPVCVSLDSRNSQARHSTMLELRLYIALSYFLHFTQLKEHVPFYLVWNLDLAHLDEAIQTGGSSLWFRRPLQSQKYKLLLICQTPPSSIKHPFQRHRSMQHTSQQKQDNNDAIGIIAALALLVKTNAHLIFTNLTYLGQSSRSSADFQCLDAHARNWKQLGIVARLQTDRARRAPMLLSQCGNYNQNFPPLEESITRLHRNIQHTQTQDPDSNPQAFMASSLSPFWKQLHPSTSSDRQESHLSHLPWTSVVNHVKINQVRAGGEDVDMRTVENSVLTRLILNEVQKMKLNTSWLKCGFEKEKKNIHNQSRKDLEKEFHHAKFDVKTYQPPSAVGLLRYQKLINPPQKLLVESNSGQPTYFARKHSQIKFKSFLYLSLPLLYYLVSKAKSSSSSLFYLQCFHSSKFVLNSMISSTHLSSPSTLFIFSPCSSFLVFQGHLSLHGSVKQTQTYCLLKAALSQSALNETSSTLWIPVVNRFTAFQHLFSQANSPQNPQTKIPIPSPPHSNSNLTNYHSYTPPLPIHLGKMIEKWIMDEASQAFQFSGPAIFRKPQAKGGLTQVARVTHNLTACHPACFDMEFGMVLPGTFCMTLRVWELCDAAGCLPLDSVIFFFLPEINFIAQKKPTVPLIPINTIATKKPYPLHIPAHLVPLPATMVLVSWNPYQDFFLFFNVPWAPSMSFEYQACQSLEMKTGYFISWWQRRHHLLFSCMVWYLNSMYTCSLCFRDNKRYKHNLQIVYSSNKFPNCCFST
ncbi:hypothetical protein VP01_1580g2 [Puccinia sorghi]|uniref:Uncharacterized protein n=1 Tax=Puccinia sorghi TaxID=27349 RepID=A0A0L6VJG4_9BASI|nr:hypothetical protein VP01_1580g2 [Puccinia sorghi]